LKKKSEDQSLGVVGRNKAKNELSQHLSEDPLPLRKAKITMEAATKKAEKTKILAQEAQKAAERAKEEALRRAEISRQKALEMEDLFDKAEKFLEEVRSRPGGGQGALWWIERELAEARKYMPKRKQ